MGEAVQYMGGKARIARRLVGAILADTDARDVWFEPFVGGGNVMEAAAPHFRRSIGSDAHPDLILMWRHVTAGGRVPEFLPRERYQELRHAKPSWERGFAGFGASFGGRWFEGYGISPRDGEVCRQSYRTVTRQAAVFARHDVRFRCWEFGRIRPPAGAVVYCDPPYAGTKKYSTADFDYDLLYRTLIEWSATCAVYLSEYAIPDHVPARLVWSHEKSMSLNKASNSRSATENLYRIGVP